MERGWDSSVPERAGPCLAEGGGALQLAWVVGTLQTQIPGLLQLA